ncbi:outer membrane lipoprotein carrier protein LolA [Rahnella sp. C60]|uniref:LolA family protein n=1 Tax=Rahnella perminowiae TaxID=2816244 RepID=UPI001C254FA6|nr:outer membrane lipoprotein carrier protein LolA [Rahnella perminowiae]MBU9812187.1 outer membrane lipoprotein carrier protein LolA [Rahnella perminowiae]MBU9814366.1 outer membrane lipoprotein carrier protein LolA [Rahnella perminowiae]MCX2944010.1 outer membrane lipoprotein carrier protein LolA [Rahnella perminowiae]
MKVLLLLALTIFSVTANAVTLKELQQRFSQVPVLRAEFAQQRTISGMAQPLNSSGNLLIARQQGLWWQQEKPFTLTLLLTENRMVQIMAGQSPQVVTADTNPQMFQFNSLLSALFHADQRALGQNFSLNFTDLGKGAWTLVLTPKVSPLNRLFRSITLSGETFLNNIDINDMQGDATHIRFFNQKTTPATLTDAEKRHFAS